MENIRDKNIVIIGNGTSLIGKNCGKLIDEFEIVVRFNKYELNKKIECDLGSKVDITVYGFGNVKRINNIIKNDESIKFISSSQKTNKEIQTCLKFNNEKQFNYIDRTIHNEIHNEIHCPDEYRLSNGILMIMLCLKYNNKVTICNFDHNSKHYYKWKSNHTHHHNWEFEKQFINELCCKKAIKIL